MIHTIAESLWTSFAMFWEILWPLILGFGISAVVQAMVSKKRIVRLLGDDRPKTLVIASVLGAASSSCSYAAVAIARSIFRKGANFTAAMAFEIASTNLVVELGVILVVLMGWQFALAEFAGAPLMVVVIAVIFRRFLSKRLLEEARKTADKGVSGRMEGHAEMDMAITQGSIWERLTSPRGFTAVSHYFVMDWISVWRDIALGLILAGAAATFIPHSFWSGFFLSSHPTLAKIWGPLIGPVVSVVSFVCSVGNVPLAAVLWNGGISFGGVVAFIFADLIVLPVLNIYRKYYGPRMAIFLSLTFYVAMALAALAIEMLFQVLGLIPAARNAQVVASKISFNYTTILNLLFLAIAILLVIRFFRTGGREMLGMMDKPASARMGSHQHHGMQSHSDHSAQV